MLVVGVIACDSQYTPLPSQSDATASSGTASQATGGSGASSAGAGGVGGAGGGGPSGAGTSAGGSAPPDASTMTPFGGSGGSDTGGVGGSSGDGGASFAGQGGGGAGGSGGTGGPPELTEEERIAALLDAHNEVRATVVTIPPLPDLVWSDSLAEIAQDWADTLAEECDRAAMDFSIYHRPMGLYGENIASFLSRPSPPRSTPQLAVDGWASEELCWTFGSKRSSNGGGGTEECDLDCFADNEIRSSGCGHYTQLAWRDTAEVGCGLSHCEGPANGSVWLWDIWVCNYDPPGNVIGVEPY